jgi:deferrochelatase/peroxidase EfeB
MQRPANSIETTPSADALSREDLQDVQAIIRSGFGKLTGCCYLLLRVNGPRAARAWLRGQRPTTIADMESGYLSEITQIAVTAAGLRALGCAATVIEGFSPEFVAGIAADPSRSTRLGDIAGNAPNNWLWGTGETEPHLLVMLFAEPPQIEAACQRILDDIAAAGLLLVARLDTSDMGDKEPFGFLDGVSQPAPDWHGAFVANPTENMAYRNIMALGEVLLGYRNEYDLFTERPLLDGTVAGSETLPVAVDQPDSRDLGRNGSYLVFRQLDQDVRGFWRWMQRAAGTRGAEDLAEAMVGRRMSGDPLAGLGSADIAGIEEKDRARNGFDFMQDRQGYGCPIAAHIRRANPRTGDFPEGRQGLLVKLLTILGLIGTAEADTIASSRFHRLIRRGREYGRKLVPRDAALPDAPDPQSGLHFICLNANIARQFEFVQGAWLNNAKFAGLGDEADPLLGNRQPFPADHPTDRFRRPSADGSCRTLQGMPQFIHVRGGAYFFLPGLRALSWIARD